jgi:hypothetical protein
MRKTLSIFLSLLFLFTFPGALSAIEIEEMEGAKCSTGLRFSYERAQVKFADDAGVEGLGNTFTFGALLLELDLKISRNFILEAVAGYGLTHFNDPVLVTRLPLSLDLEPEWNGSLVLGLVLKWQPFYWGNFSFHGNVEFIYVKQLTNEWDIRLPIVGGTAAEEHFFYQGTLDVLIQYDGFLGVTPFFGPQFNMIKGRLTLFEEIGNISARQELEYRQKNLLGVCAGARFELGRHWEMAIRANFLSRTYFSIEAFYLF